MYHYNSCGLDNIFLVNGYEIIETADGNGVSIQDIDGLHKAIASALVNSDILLTGKEFRFLRVEMDLSQKAIGGLMGVTDQAIAKWEKGEIQLPVLADKAIRDHYSESIGGGTIAGLLEKLSKIDRDFHQAKIELELLDQDRSWHAQAA